MKQVTVYFRGDRLHAYSSHCREVDRVSTAQEWDSQLIVRTESGDEYKFPLENILYYKILNLPPPARDEILRP